jgi:hypothetical protein
MATTQHTVVIVDYDGGACRCDKILSPWGGKTTHTTGQCRHLPEPTSQKGQSR